MLLEYLNYFCGRNWPCKCCRHWLIWIRKWRSGGSSGEKSRLAKGTVTVVDWQQMSRMKQTKPEKEQFLWHRTRANSFDGFAGHNNTIPPRHQQQKVVSSSANSESQFGSFAGIHWDDILHSRWDIQFRKVVYSSRNGSHWQDKKLVVKKTNKVHTCSTPRNLNLLCCKKTYCFASATEKFTTIHLSHA